MGFDYVYCMSDQFTIKDLPTNLDEKKRYWVSGKTLLIIFGLIERLWKGDNVGAGLNIIKKAAAGGGYSLAATGKSSLGGGSGAFPWQVSIRSNPDDPSLFQASVEIESDLLKSLKANDSQNVTGLGTWFDFIASDVIWLEISISSYTSSSASIDSYGQGDSAFDPTAEAWTTGGYVESSDNSNPTASQIVLRVLLAHSYPDPDTGAPTLVQDAFDHLLLSFYPTGVLARPAVVALPSPYREYFIPSP